MSVQFMRKIVCTVFFLTVLFSACAQDSVPSRIDLHGVILDADGLQPVYNVNVYVRHGYGTVSNSNGYFNLRCSSGDTVLFSHVGYRLVRFVVPDTIFADNRTVGIIMQTDTVQLPEVVVLPFVTYARMKYEVANMEPDAELQIAFSNVADAVDLALKHSGDSYFDASAQQLSDYSARLQNAGMYAPDQTLNLIGFNNGLTGYLRHLKSKKNNLTRPNYRNVQKQMQMVGDVRKFIMKQIDTLGTEAAADTLKTGE